MIRRLISKVFGSSSSNQKNSVGQNSATEIAHEQSALQNQNHDVDALGYLKLEPRRVLTVVGTFNAVTGELDISLDADNDTAVIDHDGTFVTINGSTDLDPLTVGDQKAKIADLKIIDVDGVVAKTNLAVDFDGLFDSVKVPQLADISVDNVESVDFNGTYELSGNLTVNLDGTGGGLTDGAAGALTISGTTTIAAGDNAITLDNATTHDFKSTVALSNTGAANNIVIEDTNAIELGNISTDANLTVTSGGALTDANGSTISVAKLATFDGTSITLGDNAGDTINFGTVNFNSAGAVSISEDSGTDIAGTNTADSLDLDSTGAISDDAAASITVTNNADFNGTKITIGDAGTDNFKTGSLTFNSAGDVAITEDDGMNVVGTNTAAGLALTSTAALTDDASAKITATGNASLSGSTVTIGEQGTDQFNAASLTFNSAGAVVISEDSDTELSGTSTADSLDLDSTGAITDDATASVTVTNNADFAGTKITLGDAGTDNFKAGSLTFNSAGDVAISEDDDTNVIGTNTGAAIALTSAGALTDDASAKITATGNASLGGTTVTIGEQGTDLFNAASLTFNSTGAVVISEDSDTKLSGTSTADSLDLDSTGAITDDATASTTVTNNADFAGTSITLGDAGTDNFKAGSLTFNTAGAVAISEDDATKLEGTNTADSLALTSAAGITDDTTAKLNVTNNTALNGTSVTLGDNGGDQFNTGTLTFTSAGAVNVTEDSDTTIVGTNTAGSLDLTSTGTVEDDAAASTIVTGTAAFSGTKITIGDAGTDTFKAGSLTFNSAGDVAIIEDDATNLAGSSTAANLTLTSGGALTDDATASTVVTGSVVLDATSMTIGDNGGDTFKAGTLNFNSAGDVAISEDDAMDVTGTNTAKNLDLSSVAALSDDATAKITVTENAAFAGATVKIGDSATDLYNAASTTFNSAGAVEITENSDTVLSDTSTADSLDLNSKGTITDDATASTTVTNNADFSGTSITLGDGAGDNFKAGTLTFNTVGTVAISENDDMTLAGANTALSVDLDSTIALTNNAGASLAVTTSADFAGASIDIGSKAGDSFSAATITFNSAGSVAISEDSATVVTGTNTGGSLDLTSTAALADDATAKITVTGNSSFSATAITIGDLVTDVFNSGSVTFNSAGVVAITEDSASEFAGTSTAAALTFISAGNLTDADDTSIDVTGAAAFTSGGDIELADNPDDDANDKLSVGGAATFLTTAAGFIRIGLDSGFHAFDCSMNAGESDSGATVNFGTLFFNTENGAGTLRGDVSIKEDGSTSIVATSLARSLYLGTGDAISDALFGVIDLADPSGGTKVNMYLDSDLAIDLAGPAGSDLTVEGLAVFKSRTSTIEVGRDSGGKMVNFGSVAFHGTSDVSIFENSDLEIGCDSTAGKLTLHSTGAITDGPDTNLTVTNDAIFKAGGSITLAEDSNANGTGVGSATDAYMIGGNASFTGTAISVGQDGAIAGSGVAGADVNFGTLTFNSAGAVSIAEDSASEITGTNTAATLDLDSGGALTDDASASTVVTGNADVSGASINLGDNVGDTFTAGTLTFNSVGAVAISEDDAMVIDGTNTADSSKLTSTATITDTAAASMTVTNNASFSGTAITIGDNAGDHFSAGSLTFNSAGAVVVSENDDMLLDGSSTADSADLDSTGAISDSGIASTVVTNNADFAGTSITIGDAGTDTFTAGSITFNSAGAVAISEDDATSVVGTNTADSLDLDSTATITDDTSASINVTNNADFAGTTVTIGETGTDEFKAGSLTFNSAGTVTVFEDDAMVLENTSSAGDSILHSATSITDDANASTTITGNAIFKGTSIDIGDSGTDIFKAGSVTFDATGLASISEDDDMVLDGTSSAGSADLDSSATITDTATASTTVTGNADFAGTAITIGEAVTDNFTAGSLTFNSVGAVVISEDDAMVLDGTSTAASSDLDSSTSITDSAAASLTVTGNADFAGTSITIGDQGTDNFKAGSLTFNSTGAVVVSEDDATLLDNTNTADSLDLDSAADIGDSATASTTVTNNADFAGSKITIGEAGTDNFKAGSLTFNTAGDVVVSEDDDMQLSGTSTSATANLDSTGAISDDAAASLTVTGNADFAGTSINIGDLGTDNFKAGSITFNSAGSVAISEDDAMLIDNVNTAASSKLVSTAGINDSASASINVTGNASFAGTGVTIGEGAGDTFNAGTLTFSSVGTVIISEDSAMDLDGTSTAAKADLDSVAAISDEAGASTTVTGNVDFAGTSIAIGDSGTDTFNAGSITFNSAGDTAISENSSMMLAGANTADNLSLASEGNIEDSATASTKVAASASFNADNGAGNIALGDGAATIEFDQSIADASESTSFTANNVFLEVDSKLNLGSSTITDTLFVETNGADRDIAQVAGTITASKAAFNTSGSLQLISANVGTLAVETDGNDSAIAGITINPTVNNILMNQQDPFDLTTKSFGIMVESMASMKIGEVADPQGLGTTLTGVLANTGSIYIETSGGGALTIAENVRVADGTQTITAIADGSFSIVPGAKMIRGAEAAPDGQVTKVAPDLLVTDPTGNAANNYYVVKSNNPEAFVEFQFGDTDENNFTANIDWADNKSKYYDETMVGDTRPVGSGTFLTLQKPNNFTEAFLFNNPSFDSTLRVQNDSQINAFENGGNTNLNEATVVFTQVTDIGKAFAFETPEIELPESVQRPIERTAPVADNNFTEPEEFDDVRPAVAQDLKVWSIRIEDDDADLKEFWNSTLSAEEIKQLILQNDGYDNGTYRIYRQNTDGTIETIETFEKMSSPSISRLMGDQDNEPLVQSEKKQRDPEAEEQHDLAVWKSQWQKWMKNGKFPTLPGSDGTGGNGDDPMPEMPKEHHPAAAAAVAMTDDLPSRMDDLGNKKPGIIERLSTQIASGAMLSGAMLIANRKAKKTAESDSTRQGDPSLSENPNEVSFSKSARRRRRIRRDSN